MKALKISRKTAKFAVARLMSPVSTIGAAKFGPLSLVNESAPTMPNAEGWHRIQPRLTGICGSDLHYFAHGKCGNFVPTQPFILGHEFAGEIVAHGEGVQSPAIGTRVAVDPSRACGRCKQCRQGRYNLCPKMVYCGSASVTPPCNGCYAEYITAPAQNCWPLPDGRYSKSCAAPFSAELR